VAGPWPATSGTATRRQPRCDDTSNLGGESDSLANGGKIYWLPWVGFEPTASRLTVAGKPFLPMTAVVWRLHKSAIECASRRHGKCCRLLPFSARGPRYFHRYREQQKTVQKPWRFRSRRPNLNRPPQRLESRTDLVCQPFRLHYFFFQALRTTRTNSQAPPKKPTNSTKATIKYVGWSVGVVLQASSTSHPKKHEHISSGHRLLILLPGFLDRRQPYFRAANGQNRTPFYSY